MSDRPEFFTDLEGTIPAREGDRVALAKNLGGQGIDGRSVFPHQRPLLKDGYLWFDQITAVDVYTARAAPEGK